MSGVSTSTRTAGAESPRRMAREFRARMARIALALGLVTALAPPAVAWWLGTDALEAQSQAYADGLARPLNHLVTRQPTLWSYNVLKVVAATASFRDAKALGSVRIVDCRGDTLFSPDDLELGSGRANGPEAWAAIEQSGRTIAWIQVTADGGPSRAVVGRVAGASAIFALALGLLVFLVPTRAVSRQSDALVSTLAQLARAEEGLRATNADLEVRVHEAVQAAQMLSVRVISIQEEERGRLARDLHDSVGQMLAALRLQLDAQAERGESRGFAEALRVCEESIEELRRVVRDLRPLELQTEGLANALRMAAEKLELRTGVSTVFRHRGPDVEDEALSLCLFRVAQEAISNASRHSGADELAIVLNVDETSATLVVRDNGTGFDPSAVERGMGLTSMVERLAFVGGVIDIDTAPGRGAVIRAKAPLPAGS